MKKILSIILVLLCIMITACTKNSNVEVIGGADGPTAVLVSEENEENTAQHCSVFCNLCGNDNLHTL